MTDTVRNEFTWGVIEWLAGAEVGNSEELSLARVLLPPGNQTDLHAHDNCEEGVYVVRGRVDCEAEGSRSSLTGGQSTIVARGSEHRLVNVGDEPAELLLSYSSAARGFRLA